MQHVEVGFDDDGRVLGLDVTFWHDNGAYTPYGIIVPIITSTQLLGPYKPGAYRVEFFSLYTTTVIVTPYRGAGRPQGVYAMERTMDAIADYLGKGPGRRPLGELHPPRGDAPTTTACSSRTAGPELRLRRLPRPAGCLKALVGWDEWADYRRRRGGRGPPGRARHRLLRRGHRRRPVRGRPRPGRDQRPGQCRHRPDHPGPGAPDRLRSDRRRRARCAHRRRVRHHRRHQEDGVCRGDLRVPGRRRQRKCRRAGRPSGPRQALRLAANALEVDEADLEIVDGIVRVVGSPESAIPLGTLSVLSNPLRYAFDEAAKAATQFAGAADFSKPPVADDEEPGLEGRDFFADPVDLRQRDARRDRRDRPVTAEITILRYCVIHDCGNLINPMIVEGQVHGGVGQGVGGGSL